MLEKNAAATNLPQLKEAPQSFDEEEETHRRKVAECVWPSRGSREWGA